MSAQQTTAVPPRAGPASTRAGRLTAALERNGTLVVIVCAFALVFLVALRHALVVDGWMALVSGREIAQHGLPSHDALTVWAHGERWVDQQWLAQLAFYGLAQLGGLKLALLSHAALVIGALVGAAALALRVGATARSATWVGLAVLFAYYPEAAVMRPQSFGYPLFVAVLWLAAAECRAPSRRILLAFPLLALWSNLHGSALLGAGLVALAGLVQTAEAALGKPRRVSRRGLLLALAPWPCLLVSPYALHLPGYYETILVGGGFSHFVTEWAPTTLTAATAPVYLLVLAGMWLLGRAGGRLTTFEKLAFLATAVLAFKAVRDTAWLGLAALALLPTLLDGVRKPAVEPARLNRILGTVVLAGVAVATLSIAAKPGSWFTDGFPRAAAAKAVRAAGTDGRIFAMSGFADWLLWTHPDLRGRVAFDARFELFRPQDVTTLAAFRGRVGNWTQAIRGYRVIVLDARDDRKVADALVARRIATIAYRDRDVVVLGHRS